MRQATAVRLQNRVADAFALALQPDGTCHAGAGGNPIARGETDMAPDRQQAILEAMMHHEFYPHPVNAIIRRETHISTVFLTGATVYKIKKPVNLGFLDFTTLEKREHCCRQEVFLNRRLSSDVYLEVLPITCRRKRYALGGAGETVEFAVEMRQLADEESMLQLLKKSALTEERIDALIDRLVAFFAVAPPLPPPREAEQSAWEENLQVVERFAGDVFNRMQFEFICTTARSFARKHQRLFAQRYREGRIIDGHGDLRTDHIYFTPYGIQIIDCIEFNQRLRTLDVISDLAFLVMDLEYHHFGQQARHLIQGYILRTGDIGALPLLDFYCCYRAMVRCKVNCFRLGELGRHDPQGKAARTAVDSYLALAHGYAAAFDQLRLWIMCGLPASGKSTMAKALAAVFNLSVIRSDVVRKAIFGDRVDPSADAAFASGLYSAQATEQTYRQLFNLARDALQKDDSVIIDATFSRETLRQEVLQVAAAAGALPIFVECCAGDTILTRRLLERETRSSISDARLVHLKAFKRCFAPFDRLEGAVHVVLDTEDPPAVCLQKLLRNHSLWRGSPVQGGTHV